MLVSVQHFNYKAMKPLGKSCLHLTSMFKTTIAPPSGLEEIAYNSRCILYF